jgi:hypothetical protein
MYRLIILFMLAILPFHGQSRGIGPYNWLMVYNGINTSPGFQLNYSLDVQFERMYSPCVRHQHKALGHLKYWGVGVSYNFRPEFSELGVKGLYSPFNLVSRITNLPELQSFLFIQANRTSYSATNHFNIRPGVGLNIRFALLSAFQITLLGQSGYTLSQKILPYSKGWTHELKIGIGLDWRQLKRIVKPKPHSIGDE